MGGVIVSVDWPAAHPVYRLEMHLEGVGGHLQCVGVRLEAIDGEQRVSSKAVRDVPIGRLITEAIRKVIRQWALADTIPGGIVWNYGEIDQAARRHRAAWEKRRIVAAEAALQRLDELPPTAKNRPTYTDQDWQDIADCYLDALAKSVPAQAEVAHYFGVEKGTAGMLIRRARARGLLALTTRGVACADPP